jgi:hypothetical protein
MSNANEIVAIVPELLMNSLDRRKSKQNEEENDVKKQETNSDSMILLQEHSTELNSNSEITKEQAPKIDFKNVHQSERITEINAPELDHETPKPKNIRSIQCAKVRQRLGIILRELQNSSKGKSSDLRKMETLVPQETDVKAKSIITNETNYKQQIASLQKIVI